MREGAANGAKDDFQRYSQRVRGVVFKQRRRYTSNKKIEWMVERLFQGLLIVWGIILIRWFILITIATLRHFGVLD